MNLEDCPFENKKIREVFDLATETWPEALVKEYRRKEKAKEQKTSLPSKAEKTYLLKREILVSKVCITQAFAGHHYVLVAPPLRTLEEDRGFKLPGGKCSHKDMLPEDDGAYVAVRAAIQNDIWGDAASKIEAVVLLILHVLGGLREANEELPSPPCWILGLRRIPAGCSTLVLSAAFVLKRRYPTMRHTRCCRSGRWRRTATVQRRLSKDTPTSTARRP